MFFRFVRRIQHHWNPAREQRGNMREGAATRSGKGVQSRHRRSVESVHEKRGLQLQQRFGRPLHIFEAEQDLRMGTGLLQ